MLDTEDSQDVGARVFFETLKPWKNRVDLVTGVATEDNVCKDTHEGENV